MNGILNGNKNYCDLKKEFRKTKQVIYRMNIKEDKKFLDVNISSNALYDELKDKKLKKYIAIDTSSNENEDKDINLENNTCLHLDFNKKINLNEKFDYICIYHNIDHFNDLDCVFDNAKQHLNKDGKFIIAHESPRKKINKDELKDEELLRICSKKKFKRLNIIDEDYFYFEGMI